MLFDIDELVARRHSLLIPIPLLAQNMNGIFVVYVARPTPNCRSGNDIARVGGHEYEFQLQPIFRRTPKKTHCKIDRGVEMSRFNSGDTVVRPIRAN